VGIGQKDLKARLALGGGFDDKRCYVCPSELSGVNVKTALITGASKGIGYETARQLATKGFHVFLGVRNVDSGRKAADALAKKGAKVTFLQLDVSDLESVSAAPGEFAKAADHLDVLVNNAGILLDGDSALLTIDDELIRKTLETNTLGPLRVTRAFAPLLINSSAPRVINVSSGGGQLTDGADGWAPAYCISKTALNGVNLAARGGAAKFRRELRLPRLGTHRHGRLGCSSLGRGRRRHDRVARDRCTPKSNRQFSARSPPYSVVNRLTLRNDE